MRLALFTFDVWTSRLRRLFRWWGARTLALNGFSSLFDFTALFVSVKLLGFPTQAGAICGASIGFTLSFFLNRRFAFRQHHGPLGVQAARYAATVALAMLVHAWLMGVWVHEFEVPLLAAKVAADALVFSGAQMLALRYFVFPKKPMEGPVTAPEALPAPRPTVG